MGCSTCSVRLRQSDVSWEGASSESGVHDGGGGDGDWTDLAVLGTLCRSGRKRRRATFHLQSASDKSGPLEARALAAAYR